MVTRDQIQSKIDNLNKPKGSLGRLETLALQICEIQQTLTPCLSHPCHILFGGDHGIEKEGVSFSPREITWQQMINYTRGGGGVNMFCRQHGFKFRIVDVGVDHDFPECLISTCDSDTDNKIINCKIAYGTNNFLYGPAMTENEWQRAITVGEEQVDACHKEGCNIISFGEMGIGNTSPSSILMHLLLDIPLEDCVGAGSGLDSDGLRHKYEVLKQAVSNFHRRNQRLDATFNRGELEKVSFCGFEMAAAVGAMLRAAEHCMIILVDGFIMTACMLVAQTIDPTVMNYAVFGHCGDESGHKRMLDAMNAQPLLHLGMRLGEGTGAICAYPIVQSAVNMINEMDNFQHAEITKYF